MRTLQTFSRTGLALAASAVLAGCASLSPDGGIQDISTTSAPSLAALGVPKAQIARAPTAQTQKAVAKLLAAPSLTLESAVYVALLNNPAIAMSFAQLRISEADRVQAATLATKHSSIVTQETLLFTM